MYSFGTNVLFACRQCKDSFQIINDFIEHKKEEHSVEFRTSNCIVFEDILILNTNNGDDDGSGSSMLSTVTVTMENESEVSCPKKNVPAVEIGIGTALTNFDLDLCDTTQPVQHDPAADSFRPFPTSTWDNQNSGNTNEDTSYQDQDDDTAFDNILEEIHDDFETADSIQVSTDVSLSCIAHEKEFPAFERDPELNTTTYSVNMNPFPQNPYVLLKKLSLKEIQNYSRLQDQQQQDTIIKVEVTPEPDAQCQWCKLCLKEFRSEAEFEIHHRACILDTNNKKLYCSHCNKIFAKTYARNVHMIRYHGTEEEQRNLFKFRCSICQKGYIQRPLLTYHMEYHKNKTERNLPFKCEQCGTSFIRKPELTRHEAIHSLTRPFKCPEPDCKKSYKIKDHLRNHLKFIHSNMTELFKCPEFNCPNIYKYKDGLRNHLKRRHDGNKLVM